MYFKFKMKRCLMTAVAEAEETTKLKITVVGAGAVGMATCMAIACQKICDVIAIVDMMTDKVKGEGLDLDSASIYTNCRIIADSDR
ncbi:L-lactate dehydrogenase B chain [Blattella germanica]|nr:L-lactate dehydrogenase B chain [Blattella germanica]